MPEKAEKSTKSRSISDYFRQIRDAKKSGAVGRIFEILGSIERFERAHELIPSKYHATESLYTAPVVIEKNIRAELTWGSAILQRQRADIEQYLIFKRSIEELILQSNWSAALALILDFELKNGTASVIKELAIAVTQQAEGTAKQVAYSRKLEVRGTENAFAHFIRFASERNEDRLTLSGFRRNLAERFDSTTAPPLAIAIVRWHGLHQLPEDETLLSELLSFEECGSIFDYFEAFVAIATHLGTRSSHPTRIALRNSLQRLTDFSDRRILNLQRLLAGRYAEPSTPLLVANVLSQIRARSNREGSASATEKLILRLLNDANPNSDARRHVHKLSANFFHLDYFQAVFCHLEHKASAVCLDQAVSPGLGVLANDTTLRSMFACSTSVVEDTLARSNPSMNLHQFVESPIFPFACGEADVLLFRAIALAKSGDVKGVISLAQSAQLNAIDLSHLQLIAVRACHEAGRDIDLLPFALEISEIRLDALSLVPIVDALEKILPGRLAGRDAVLFSIVASRVLLLEESDRLEDKLMVAAEVAFPDRSTPHWVHSDTFSLKLWVKFLREVMTIQNMLLIDEVNSLRDALNLRVEVLRQLDEHDPENRAKYHEEVRDIAFNLSVDEGIRQVNTSRLNVNVQGLTKWANDHCVDDFERYKELVIGETTAGDMPVKLTTGTGSFFDQLAGIPLGVADDQIVKLLIRIRNAYLSDPRNGLDAYISLRVRHGSLSGTLSRALDIRQLLLLRKSESGPFEAPQYWIDRLGLSGFDVTEATRAFAKFTTAFRTSIDHLLKNRLRVKNEKNPQGEITVELTDIFVKGLKVDIVGGLQFDTFISYVLLSYKNAVSTYLDSLRKYLKTDFLNETIRALESLSTDVGAIVGDGEQWNHLNDVITNARLDLQGSIKIVCDWLEIAQKEDLAQLYTLNQATEIGIYYTRQVRNNFSPNIQIYGVDESFRLPGVSLMVIVDILFILLDNVYKHAGDPNERAICLRFDLSENGLIKLKMQCDLAKTTDRAKVAAGLDGARKLIADKEVERKLTEEDQSGLPKLSRLVAQDRSDALSFELTHQGVEVNVSMIYSTLDMAE